MVEGFRATLKPPINYTLRTNRKMIRHTLLDVLEHSFWIWQRFRSLIGRIKGDGGDCGDGGALEVKVESCQLLEDVVVKHFEIEVVIVVEEWFFSKLVLRGCEVFLRSLKRDLKKT
ncbi:hypothetical protein Tco_1057104 [Tanacetum coccineum]|uniref:Uncharacterized protein n=1 Tax=Tanacetum coccineum TaxID=301880 RepID=A0ABQ5H697_9ASTR